MNEKFKILIVGCGELGSRHLQAVATLPTVEEIVVVDSNATAIQTGQSRLKDLPGLSSHITFRWLSSLEAVKGTYDLCIVATLAQGRCALIKKIANQLGIRQFLIEKIVSQSSSEYADLLQFAEANRLEIRVNCKTRAYPIHQHVKKQLRPGEPILFSAMGGNHGLANNGVHTSDLFIFYDESPEIQLVSSAIEPTLHVSKRGKDIFDLSGTLTGKTDKGSTFMLSYAGDHVASEQFSIVTKSYRCIIDQMLRWAFENDGEKGSPWRPLPFEGNLMVSQMTKTFVTEMFEKRNCHLPLLNECWPAHRFILDALQPHFNRLSGEKRNHCPVT
ncbi:MAG: hypothetical protein A3H42_01635 [Deltaproteobacteria bacterium RIFCSPLOWO2_02_FULL_46_8]|nr:MAG: hypothetical protein A3H42_01635 [Deltaproteobacteria bacterium RIFCSPLOWO2_02_FULL_46_8]